jgi:phosphate transport system protein
MPQAREHTLKAFDEDLEPSARADQPDGRTCGICDRRAMRCLVQRDLEGARRIVEDDKKLDALEIETERRVVQLIALRAPMAGDLRESSRR